MKTYKLLVEMPMFYDKAERGKVLYQKWCEQFPLLSDTMDFLADLENVTPIKSYSPIYADYIGMDFGRGETWTNDNGSECDFNGWIITVETEACLEEYIPLNHIYKENHKRNDFVHGKDYCVLEGGSSMTDKTLAFIKEKKIKPFTMGLLNLYQYPEKIKELESHSPSYLIIDTTLFDKEGILAIMSVVEGMDYVPEKIYYLNEVITEKYPYVQVKI